MSLVRTRWVWVAFWLSLTAVGVELTLGICASIFFDPLPDLAHLAAYGLVVVMLVYNERIALGDAHLWPSQDRTKRVAEMRRLAAGLIGTSAALFFAGMASLMHLPLSPFAFVGILFLGLGALNFAPMLCFGVLIAQWRAMRARWKSLDDHEWDQTPVCPTAKVGLLVALVPVALFAWFVARPFAIGYSFYAATLTDGPQREASLDQVRRLGGEAEALAAAYDRKPSFWASLGGETARCRLARDDAERAFSLDPLVSLRGWNTENARRDYYLLTGRTVETEPVPWTVRRQGGGMFGSSFTEEEFAYRNEQGGETVGRRVKGLSLASSRLTGVLDARSETATTEWILTFHNATPEAQEARCRILLPPGGVVDKVSLWINGEERPAAFGAKGQVRAAYEDVAGFRGPMARDPLLVTCEAPGHVLAQCFPVPPQGDMKIKIGLSAPLVWQNVSDPRLVFAPPQFSGVNFALPSGVRHEMRLRARNAGGKTAWDGAAGGWRVAQNGRDTKGSFVTASRYLPAPDLLNGNAPALTLAGARRPQAGDRLDGSLVREASPFPTPGRAVDLILVVDTTAQMSVALDSAAREQLDDALSALPLGSRVRLVDARDARTATDWLPAARAVSTDSASWWRARRWVGGVDAAPTLAWAADEAKRADQTAGRVASTGSVAVPVRGKTAVVWLHGATPEGISDPQSLLTSLVDGGEKRVAPPPLIGVRLSPAGSDALMDRLTVAPRVYALAARQGTNVLAAAVETAALASQASFSARTSARETRVPLGGRAPAINGVWVARGEFTPGRVPVRVNNTPASRLADHARVLAAWYRAKQGPELVGAGQLAARRRLVTPLSGAVVLENQAQYKRHKLSDKDESHGDSESDTFATPEPGTLALVGLGAAGGALIGALRRRRHALRLSAVE